MRRYFILGVIVAKQRQEADARSNWGSTEGVQWAREGLFKKLADMRTQDYWLRRGECISLRCF